MRTLVAVARMKSFNGAARSLGISGSFVSRQIAHLEGELGVRLVNRTARSITLTEAGKRYTAFAARILSEIAEEDAWLAGPSERAQGTLNVIAPQWIGSLDLGEAVARFAFEHPLVNVRLGVGGLSDLADDSVESGFDVAFHTGQPQGSSLTVQKIADLQFVVCASPAYLARRRIVRDPEDLATHSCLVHVNDAVWRFADGPDATEVTVAPMFSSNTYLVLKKAAVRGQGVALLPLDLARGDLMDGRLELVLADHAVRDRPLSATYERGREMAAEIRLFLDFVRAWFEARIETR